MNLTNGTAQGNEEGKDVVSLALKVTAYSIIMLISLVGNFLVIITYKMDQNELKKLVMSATICHMAVADLMITIFGIPSMISLLMVDRRWLIPGQFGEALCKIYTYALEVGVFVSALSIAVIAVERFLSVFFPLRKIMTIKAAHITSGIVWIGSCCFYAPKFYTNTVIKYGQVMHCTSDHSQIKPWREIEASLVALLFLVTLVLYMAIVVKVTKRNSIPGRVVTENSHLARSRTNRRVIRQGLGVITIHYLCWMPYLWTYIVCVVFRLQVKNVCSNMGIFQDFFIFFLGFSNAALNPLLYTATNDSFRKGCKKVLQNICSSCGVRRISPSSTVRSSRGVCSNGKLVQQQPAQGETSNDQHLVSLERDDTGQITEDKLPSKEFPRVIVVTTR